MKQHGQTKKKSLKKMMKTMISSIVVMMMIALTSAKSGVKCDICSTTSIVVENVLLHNATAGYTFQNAAAALCANVPREMRETVRNFSIQTREF